MRSTKHCNKVVLKKWFFYFALGEFIDVGLLGEDHHKTSLIACESLLSNEGVVPSFVDHFLHHLVEQRDPYLIIMKWLKLCSSFKTFLHTSYTATRNGQSGVILYLVPHMINHF